MYARPLRSTLSNPNNLSLHGYSNSIHMSEPLRCKLWVLYLFFMLVVQVEVYKLNYTSDETGADTGISLEVDYGFGVALLLLSLLGIVIMVTSYAHPFLRRHVVGKMVEGIILAAVLIFSIILCAIASGPAKGLAVDEYGAVRNGNVYYFSWMAFGTGLYLASSYLTSVHGIDVTQRFRDVSLSSSSPSTFPYWVLLFLSSLIVMSTSIALHFKNCPTRDGDGDGDGKAQAQAQSYCSRTVIGITTGLLAAFVSLVTCAMTTNHIGTTTPVPFLGEVGLVALLFLLYCIEVAFVTDGDGPGAPLGNLYYFSWISIFLTIKIGMFCHDTYVEVQNVPDGEIGSNVQMNGRSYMTSGHRGIIVENNNASSSAAAASPEEDLKLDESESQEIGAGRGDYTKVSSRDDHPSEEKKSDPPTEGVNDDEEHHSMV